MVWWYSNDQSWKIFGWKVEAFSDVPATCSTELVKGLVAQHGRDIDPYASQVIEEDCYCDNACTGGFEDQVSKMIGTATHSSDSKISFSGTIQKNLTKGGFRVKMMVWSGEQDQLALAKMGGTILGHFWDPTDYFFTFKQRVYLRKWIKNGLHSGPELTAGLLHMLDSLIWTMRLVLSAIKSIYDPAGTHLSLHS